MDIISIALWAGYGLGIITILGALGIRLVKGRINAFAPIATALLLGGVYLGGGSVFGLSSATGAVISQPASTNLAGGAINCGDVTSATVIANVWNSSSSTVTRATADVFAYDENGVAFANASSSATGGASLSLPCGKTFRLSALTLQNAHTGSDPNEVTVTVGKTQSVVNVNVQQLGSPAVRVKDKSTDTWQTLFLDGLTNAGAANQSTEGSANNTFVYPAAAGAVTAIGSGGNIPYLIQMRTETADTQYGKSSMECALDLGTAGNFEVPIVRFDGQNYQDAKASLPESDRTAFQNSEAVYILPALKRAYSTMEFDLQAKSGVNPGAQNVTLWCMPKGVYRSNKQANQPVIYGAFQDAVTPGNSPVMNTVALGNFSLIIDVN